MTTINYILLLLLLVTHKTGQLYTFLITSVSTSPHLGLLVSSSQYINEKYVSRLQFSTNTAINVLSRFMRHN